MLQINSHKISVWFRKGHEGFIPFFLSAYLQHWSACAGERSLESIRSENVAIRHRLRRPVYQLKVACLFRKKSIATIQGCGWVDYDTFDAEKTGRTFV